MRVEITVEGTADLVARFETVEKGLDFRQLGTWDAVASEFYKIEKEQFQGGGVGKSGRWQALSPKYAAIKTRKYYGPTRILIATGKLYRSITSKNGADAVFEKTASELTLGTKVPYASYHQTGTRAPSRRGGRRGVGGLIGPVRNLQGPHRGGMPARPIIDLTDEQANRLTKVVQGKMKQLIANAKLRDIRGF